MRIAWLTMLSKKGADHVVYCDAWKLHKWANITIEEAEEALKVLSNPDRRKPGQESGGRRIKKVEDGWEILNGQKYEDLMRKTADRIRKAKWARENRSKLKVHNANPHDEVYDEVSAVVDENNLSCSQ